MSKSKGKIALSIIGAFFGAANPAFFGTKSAIMGGHYGASLGTSIWSAMHPPQTESTSKFDQLVNTVSNSAMIPVIYGTRKCAGLQTYHKATVDGNNLTKDIIVAEGEVDSVYGVCANELIFKNNQDQPITVYVPAMGGNLSYPITINASFIFGIMNTNYADAYVQIWQTNSPTPNDKILRLHANGQNVDIILCSANDINNTTTFDYNARVDLLISHISKIGNGWVVINPVPTANRAEDIIDIPQTACYNTPVSVNMSPLPNCSYDFYNGTQGPPSNYMTVGSYKNMAYIRALLRQSDRLQGGNPNITYICRGRKVTDTRTNTYGYSDNPAYIVRDYLLSKRFGCGHYITSDLLDEDSFKEVADYCDTLVSYQDTDGVTHYEKRFSLNIVIDQKRKHIENLSNMFASFGGFLTFTNNKISLRIEKATPISYSFNDSNIVKGSVSFTQTPLEQTPNRYNIKYYEPSQNWVSTLVLVEDVADQLERGKIISKDIELQGCISQTQAMRLGRFYRDFTKQNNIIVQFQTATMAMHLEPGDVVNFTYKGLLLDFPVRILEIQEANGVWTIKAQQYNESIYNDNVGAQIKIKDYSPIDSPLIGNVPDVSNIQLSQNYYKQGDGTIVSDLIVTSTLPSYPYIDTVNFEYSIDNGVTWVNAGHGKDGNFTIHNAIVGKYYIIKAKVINTTSRTSTGVTSSSLLITGNNEPPGDITFFDVEQLPNGSKRFHWKLNNPPVDLAGYKIRYNKGASVFWDSGTPLHSGLLVQSPFETLAIGSGVQTIMIKAVDFSGNESANVASIVVGIGDETIDNVIIEKKYEDTFGTITSSSFTRASVAYKENGTQVGVEATQNILPSGSENFVTGWAGLSGATPTITDYPVNIPGIGDVIAKRIQTSGGTNQYKYYCAVSGLASPHQVTSTLYAMVLSGNARFATSSVTNPTILDSVMRKRLYAGTSVASIYDYIYLGCANAGDSLDIVVYAPQMELKPYATDYILPGTSRAAVNNVPRFETAGLKIEEAATNYVSTNFALWAGTAAGTGVTPIVTPNYAVAPDGRMTATRLQVDIGAGNTITDRSYITYNVTGLANPHDQSAGVWAKTADGSTKQVLIYDNIGSNIATITGEWQFFTFTSLNVPFTASEFRIGLRGTYAVSSSADLLLWEPMFEPKKYLTSTCTVSRAAESLTFPASLVNPNEGAFVFDFMTPASWASLPNFTQLMYIYHSSGNAIGLYKYNSTVYAAITVGGVEKDTTTAGVALSASTKYRLVPRYGGGKLSLWINGARNGAEITGVVLPFLLPASGNLGGKYFGNSQSNGQYSNFAILNKAPSDAWIVANGTPGVAIPIDDDTTFYSKLTNSIIPDRIISGTKVLTNCSVVGNELWANDPGSMMYTSDSAPMYTSDSADFYANTYGEMSYEDTFTPNDSGVFFMLFEGQGDEQLYYKRLFPNIMFPDANAYFWTDDSDAFWKEATEWLPYSSKTLSVADEYGVKCVIKSGTQGIIHSLKACVDVPDIVETHDDIVISASGTRLTPKNTFRTITNVNITLQDDGGSARTAKIIDKNPTLGALIKVYDSSGNATTGLIDATQKGY